MKKTPVWQIALLVVLLGLLSFAVYRAFSGAVSPRRTAPAAGQPAAKGAAPGAAPATGGTETKATDMPDVVPTTSRGRLGEGIDAGAKAAQINPNLFKVYQVQPPKNPFMQEEEWYQEKIEQVPGYPELTEGDYFDSMDVYLPDISFIYDNPDDWRSVSVKRGQDNKYSLTGTSKDGLIQTQIALERDIPTDATYGWEKGSDVPLSALQNPDWVMEQIRIGQNQALAPEEEEGQVFDENGLPLPGGQTTSGAGDSFACYGVSVKGANSSALMLYNGAPWIVTKGMVLPTHYQVMEINADGVVLVDLKTGFSIPVPLGGETSAGGRQFRSY
jgi:hypothetical protein